MGICESKPNQQSNPNPNMAIGQYQNITHNNKNVENKIKEMSFGDNIPVSLEIANQAMKSICKNHYKK